MTTLTSTPTVADPLLSFQFAPSTPPLATLRAECAASVGYTPADCTAQERSALDKRAAEQQFPYPPKSSQHPLTAFLANADLLDSDLLDDVYGVEVTFMWTGSPGVYARRQLTGVIVGVETQADGERWLWVKADLLNLPRWVALKNVQFVGNGVQVAARGVEGAR